MYNNNNECLYKAYYGLSIALTTQNILIMFNATADSLQQFRHHPHFIGQGAEACQGSAHCPVQQEEVGGVSAQADWLQILCSESLCCAASLKEVRVPWNTFEIKKKLNS